MVTHWFWRTPKRGGSEVRVIPSHGRGVRASDGKIEIARWSRVDILKVNIFIPKVDIFDVRDSVQ